MLGRATLSRCLKKEAYSFMLYLSYIHTLRTYSISSIIRGGDGAYGIEEKYFLHYISDSTTHETQPLNPRPELKQRRYPRST